MFEHLDYKKYCLDNNIAGLFGMSVPTDTNVDTKTDKSLYETVDPKNNVALPAELDDLTRLHFLVRSRKVVTILEFGVGKSTLVFADALQKNKQEFGEFVKNNIRKTNPFEVHCVENTQAWIDQCKQNFSPDLLPLAKFHFSPVQMTTFNGRACTMYDKLPNISPDLIYLDAPDLFSVLGDVHGISTASSDRLPMAADVLLLEPFLLPGTLIVVDGRTANARFLKNNFQRNWQYHHFAQEDIHTFELVEAPLGKLNKIQLDFCFGQDSAKFK